MRYIFLFLVYSIILLQFIVFEIIIHIQGEALNLTFNYSLLQ